MKSTFRVALTAFSISALAAFSVVHARPATAAVVNVLGKTCTASGDGTICAFSGGTPTAQGGAMYFDFVSTGANKLVVSECYRLSYSGTLRTTNTAARYDAGFHETKLLINGMNANASVWDYVYGAVVGEVGSGLNIVSNIYGMAFVSP